VNRMMRTVRGGLAALVVAGLVQSVGSLALVTSADAAGTAMRATTAVNVRSGAGTNYSRIGLLQAGEQIQALSSKNGWTQVNYKGRTGYVASAYLASSSGGEGGGSSSGASGAAYTTTALNLRTGPALRSSVKTVASKGTKVTLTGTVRGEFSQVTWNGQTLWAATRYLSQSAGAASQDLPSTTKKLRATTALMIRTSPGRDYRSLGDVPRGTILDCTDVVTSGMAQCIWQGNVRWFNNQYLRSAGSSSSPTPGNLPSTTAQYATANLNIWNSATGSAHTGEIPKGSEVAVTGTVQSGRAQIVHNGAIRWVTARYLSSTAPGSDGGGSGDGGSGGAHACAQRQLALAAETPRHRQVTVFAESGQRQVLEEGGEAVDDEVVRAVQDVLYGALSTAVLLEALVEFFFEALERGGAVVFARRDVGERGADGAAAV